MIGARLREKLWIRIMKGGEKMEIGYLLVFEVVSVRVIEVREGQKKKTWVSEYHSW